MTASCNVEYCILEYVSNVVSSAQIPIAVIFIDSTDMQNGICTMTFAADWQTNIRRLDPDSDLEMLVALLTEIRDRLLSSLDRSDMIRQMEDSFSNVIQVSQRQKCPVAPNLETVEAFARALLGKASNLPPPRLSEMQAPTDEAIR